MSKSDINKIVNSLYDGLMDDGALQTGLEDIAVNLNATATHLLVLDRPTMQPVSGFATRFSDAHDLYVQQYAPIDPRIARFYTCNSPKPENINSVFAEQEHRSSPVYHEFLEKHDAQIGAATFNHLDERCSMVLGVMRQGRLDYFDHEELHRIEHFSAHLLKILNVRHKFTHALETIDMDNGNAISIILDADGMVLDLTEQAKSYLRGSQVLSLWRGALSVRENADNARLTRMIGAVVTGAGKVSEDMIIRDKVGEPVCRIIVKTAQQPEFTVFAGRAPKAVVLIEPIEEQPLPDQSLLQAVFELTPTEAQVALAVCQGLTVNEIAASRHVAVSTIRWTLQNMFEKLGVSGQVALVAKVLRTVGHLK